MEPKSGDNSESDKLSLAVDDVELKTSSNASNGGDEKPRCNMSEVDDESNATEAALPDDASKCQEESSQPNDVSNDENLVAEDDNKSFPPINLLKDPLLTLETGKPLRQVRSHPSLGGRTVIPPGSLGSLAMTRSLKNNFNKTGMATAVPQPGNISYSRLPYIYFYL